MQLDDGTTAFGEPGVIEVLEVLGGDGGDTIQVAPAANVGNGLYVNVDGGSPRASDALVITDFDGSGNLDAAGCRPISSWSGQSRTAGCRQCAGVPGRRAASQYRLRECRDRLAQRVPVATTC